MLVLACPWSRSQPSRNLGSGPPLPSWSRRSCSRSCIFWTSPSSPIAIFAVDGHTVRHQGQVYWLVGFVTPERGDRARCDDERRRAEAATRRLRELIVGGDARLQRVACACKP